MKHHGHAPRVRRRRNTGAEADSELVVDKQKLLNLIVTSAIGGVVGTLATRAVFEKKDK